MRMLGILGNSSGGKWVQQHRPAAPCADHPPPLGGAPDAGLVPANLPPHLHEARPDALCPSCGRESTELLSAGGGCVHRGVELGARASAFLLPPSPGSPPPPPPSRCAPTLPLVPAPPHITLL